MPVFDVFSRVLEPRAWPRAVQALVPVVAAGLVAFVLGATAPDRGLRFRASSAYPGYEAEGWSGRVHGFGLFVHTKKEKNAWVELELGGTRTVSRVEVTAWREQRSRGLPLAVEVRRGDGGWERVGLRTAPFREHAFTFPPTTTSAIRLRVDGPKATWLHLEAVDVD